MTLPVEAPASVLWALLDFLLQQKTVVWNTEERAQLVMLQQTVHRQLTGKANA